jgi:hypothetical protein
VTGISPLHRTFLSVDCDVAEDVSKFPQLASCSCRGWKHFGVSPAKCATPAEGYSANFAITQLPAGAWIDTVFVVWQVGRQQLGNILQRQIRVPTAERILPTDRRQLRLAGGAGRRTDAWVKGATH